MARTKKTKETIEPESKPLKKDFIFTVGRRREAVARVRLYEGKRNLLLNGLEVKKGDVIVNQRPIEQYFSGEVAKVCYQEPLIATNTLGKFIITVRVAGGGLNGQLEAMIHGIARALANYNREDFRPILKKKGFLTRDARTRERRKVGTGGKARRIKQSPKR